MISSGLKRISELPETGKWWAEITFEDVVTTGGDVDLVVGLGVVVVVVVVVVEALIIIGGSVSLLSKTI